MAIISLPITSDIPDTGSTTTVRNLSSIRNYMIVVNSEFKGNSSSSNIEGLLNTDAENYCIQTVSLEYLSQHIAASYHEQDEISDN